MPRRRNSGTGSVYRPTYRGPDGSLKRSRFYWIRWTENGKRHNERTDVTKAGEANLILQHKLTERNAGRRTVPALVSVQDLAEMVFAHYRANRLRSLKRQEQLAVHVQRILGKDTPANDVDEATVTDYVATRTREGAPPASINRELAHLRQGFRLALHSRRLERRPVFSLLREDNARKGFFEREQLEAVLAHLEEDVRPVIRVAYLTGWRVESELLTRERRHVDLAAGWLRLEPGETKNGKGRMFPLIPELREVLEDQEKRTQLLEHELGMVIPWLFHRRGRQIKSFRGAWLTARTAAGLPGKLVHDFRRSAVRNLERAGVPRSAAMQLVGHETESIYRRYAIADEKMLLEAGALLAQLPKTKRAK